MEPVKIMPCLDMKEGRVVKGVNFVNLRDAGDPVKNAAFYQAEGADELAMLDIAATLENRKTRLEWVKAVSAVIDIPLTVGGGIASLQDIEMTLTAGANKVSMNSAVVKDPELVTPGVSERRPSAWPSMDAGIPPFRPGSRWWWPGGPKERGWIAGSGPAAARSWGRE